MRFAWMIGLVAGCSGERSTAATSVEQTPSYQLRWGGLSVRDGDRLVEAPADDAALVQGYAAWPSKGAEVDHTRLTVMTAKTDYAVGESIHVLHVLDVSVTGRGVYIMGPKRPAGEYVDGKLIIGVP